MARLAPGGRSPTSQVRGFSPRVAGLLLRNSSPSGRVSVTFTPEARPRAGAGRGGAGHRGGGAGRGRVEGGRAGRQGSGGRGEGRAFGPGGAGRLAGGKMGVGRGPRGGREEGPPRQQRAEARPEC